MDTMKQDVTFLAKGGVCRVALDILSCNDKYRVSQICDDGQLGADQLHRFIPCEKSIGQYVNDCSPDNLFFNCIGNYRAMRARISYSSLLRQKGCKSINIIHEDSIISDTVSFGDGNLICPNVVLSTNVIIGNDNILFSGTVIEHDCRIGDNIYFSPSVSLCGKIVIEDNVYIGPGAVIAAGVHIGTRSVIGAGAVVLKDVEEGSVAFGVNAKVIKTNELW